MLPGILGDFAVDRWKFIDFTRPGILRPSSCTDKKWNSPILYWKHLSMKSGLTFSAEKCELLKIYSKDDDICLNVNGRSMKPVDVACYLGDHFNRQGNN